MTSPMAKNVTVDADMFSVGLDELIGNIPVACAQGLGKAVQQSARKTAKGLRSGAYGSSGKHAWSPEYMKGFASHAEVGGMEPEGEVGNKAKPGLVHLLEKGHLTATGRRTTAYPHMKPAFDDMEKDFIERAEDAIGEALEG